MTLDARAPILFLPARLETIFASTVLGTPQLWVRLFPDQIAIDFHDPMLTDAEISAGRAYWDALWRLGTATGTDERPPWRALAAEFGPQRAAWIAQETQPDNLAMRPPVATPIGPVPVIEHRPFAAAARRSSTWERPATGAGLPERWMVVGYRSGQVRFSVQASAIPADLPMSPSPRAPSLNPDPRDLQIDAGMRWMVDFGAAVAVGMGVAIDLAAEDAALGFDRVIAFGLGQPRYRGPHPLTHVPAPPATANEEIALLFAAHRFSDGLAFLPQGTAANNTADALRVYTTNDPGFERSFRAERADPLPQNDGAVASSMLGLPGNAFAHTEGSDRIEQQRARDMITALWPATLGYMIRNLLSDDITPAHEDELREHVRASVHGRGPVPALVIDDVPYGILPVTSIAEWRPTVKSSGAEALVGFLRRLLPAWRRSVSAAPRIRRSGDPDQDLLEVLGMDASAQSYRARHALLDELVVTWFLFLTMGVDAEVLDALTQSGRQALIGLGYPYWNPQFAHLLFSRKSFEVPDAIIQDEPLSETDELARYSVGALSGNYISWLRSASLDDVRDERYPTGTPPTSLLYKVLRASVLQENIRTATEVRIAAGSERVPSVEPVFVGFSEPVQTTVYATLDNPFVAGGVAAKVHLYNLSDRQAAAPPYDRLNQVRAALDALASVPTAELERLFTETLDCFSHRLDAWLTSLATSTLVTQRASGATGTHRGMYAWVEDLRPSPRTTAGGPELALASALDAARLARNVVGGSQAPLLDAPVDTGGFIHAPSLAHAEASAVLRHGYLSHRGTSQGQALALDLSSDRVRIACSFLDGVREGQPLGALLGYRFEAGLHAAQLDVHLAEFRVRYPQVANKLARSDEVAPPAAETVAASNVVDGLALYRAWAAGDNVWGTVVPSAADATAVETLLRDLDGAVDALGDVSIAEGVFQVMRGNFTRAGGLVDALSRGEAAPEPEVVNSPRTGSDVTHRLAVLFTAAQARPVAWPPLLTHPRVASEPTLDAWLANLLPDPGLVRCRVEATAAAGPQVAPITLSALNLAPLDVLALANALDEPQASELEQRIAFAALSALPEDTSDLRIVFEGQALGLGPNERSFPELLVLLRAARDLVSSARPLGPQDLIEPDRRTAADDLGIDALDLEQRSKAALTALQAARDRAVAPLGLRAPRDAVAVKLDQLPNPLMPTLTEIASLRAALVMTSLFGIPGAVPVNAKLPANTADPTYGLGARALRRQADEVLRTLDRRLQAANDALGGWAAGELRPTVRRERASALAKVVFGGDFVVLPKFVPPNPAGLTAAVAASAGLLAGDTLAIPGWLQQLTHVRPGVARLDLLKTVTQLVRDAPPVPLIVAQLPLGASRWAALAPQVGDGPLFPGTASMVMELVGGYGGAAPHSGLLIDEWSERIPSGEVTTGVAFHANAPGARAPNTLLLAVSPAPEIESWNDDLILRILNDTLDLAAIRAVDLDSLVEVGQLIPPLFFPFNPDHEAVGVDAIG